jgi:hypothetical protein
LVFGFFALAKQVLYYLSHTSGPFPLVSLKMGPRVALNCDPPHLNLPSS